jgi:hypothetical protein
MQLQISNRFNEFWTNTANRVIGWLSNPADQELRAQKLRDFQSGQALLYYEGNAPKALKVDPRTNVDDNVFVNYPELIVDKGVEFLFGDELGIEVEGDESAQTLLDELWSPDVRSEDLIDLATDGAIYGDTWAKIIINEKSRPEVVALDPSIWQKIVDPNNYKRVLAYRCQYKMANGRFFREETRQNETGRWETQAFESMDCKKWTAVGEISVFPFDFCPVMAGKNLPRSKSPYGRPDLTRPVLDLCRYLARTDSLIGKIVRVHASPKTVAKGISVQDLEVGVDSTLFLKNPAATLELLEMKNDLAGAIAFRKLLREALSEISKVPEVSTGKTENVGQMSGRALQILYGPLLKQTVKKRRLYGPFISKIAKNLLIAGGAKSADKANIALHWGAAISPDPMEEAQLGLVWQQVGVSDDSILQRLGFDPDEEKRKRGEEQAVKDERRSKIFNAGISGGDIYAN